MFTVMGDTILNLELNGPKGTLQIMKIRFTIIEELSCDVIIGQEVLASLDFKTSGSTVSIGGLCFSFYKH